MLQVVKMEAGDLPAATNVIHYVQVMDVIKLQEDVLHALHLPNRNTPFGIVIPSMLKNKFHKTSLEARIQV
jgi:hypothetical protein